MPKKALTKRAAANPAGTVTKSQLIDSRSAKAARRRGTGRLQDSGGVGEPSARDALLQLKAEFDDTHQQAMAAFRRRDYSALGAAIWNERRILEEQKRVIDEHVGRTKRWLPVVEKLVARARRQKAP